MYSPVPGEPLTRRLALVGKELRESFHSMLAERGCTIPTWAVLRCAHLSPGLSQVQLAGLIGIEGPTLARHLDRLCAEGLVERRRDNQDRRVVRVQLTEAGERRWDELVHDVDAFEQRLTRRLTEEQCVALDAALMQIHEALEDSDAAAHADR
jgi:MarR family transcriptional regulator for hemolysin